MIPKIVHYCWLSNDPIPEKLKTCMESWKKKLPDYEFILWDSNKFNINSSLWVKQAFENKKYAFAADYIRLYAIYNYGGIYMDMDIEVLKSFNDLMNESYFLGYELEEEGIEAGIFAAAQGSMWLKDCLDYYSNRQFLDSEGHYDMNPLPQIMYNCLRKKHKLICRTSTRITSSMPYIEIFPRDYFTAKSFQTGIITVTSNTYTIHHFAGTWIPKSRRIKDWIYKNLPIDKGGYLSQIYQKLKKEY